jgi:hypothetical protein
MLPDIPYPFLREESPGFKAYQAVSILFFAYAVTSPKDLLK